MTRSPYLHTRLKPHTVLRLPHIQLGSIAYPSHDVAVPLPINEDIATMQQGFVATRQAAVSAWQESRLPADAKYRVQDHKVPVEGGEILVRAVIPGTGEGGPYPLLVWAHGGGYAFGDVGLDDYFMRNLSTELQVTTLNVEYRLAPTHTFPTALNDCYAALKWAVTNADALSVSLKKGFLVGGCSAGGNLSAGVALRARDDPFFRNTPITGQYLSCANLIHTDAHDKYARHSACASGCSLKSTYSRFPGELLSMEQNKDVPRLRKDATVWFLKLYDAPRDDPEFAPVLAKSHAALPPAFFQICGMDPLRDEAFLYDRLLREAGNKTLVKVYPGFPHAFQMEYWTLKATGEFESDIRAGLRWLLTGNEA
ncbi:Alpha/Beta hydrolase protein [Gloeopeniophorella convolvens]|nr:Alpha/Beta hydrolase protein [Gloeopeniophorella convolvens]